MLKFNIIIFCVLLGAVFFSCEKKTEPITFSAIGDVPYSDEAVKDLDKSIADHNENSESSFLIHLGDIKLGSKPCDEIIYKNVSAQLKKSNLPVYIIPGDNEFNDCTDPDQAFSLWNKYFFHLNENWERIHEVEYQVERKENFNWIENEVAFVGLNLVGGRVHDSLEWKNRLESNADWIDQIVNKNKPSLKAMVVFGHAHMNIKPEKFESFVKGFRSTAKSFGKPILYLQGDGHHWIEDRPWEEQNILRVQVDAGANILKVKVDTDLENPFVFTKPK